MGKSDHKVIVLTTITILVTLVLFPSNVFAENGIIQIQIRGAGVGDNLKISAYTDQDSWEWRDSFTIGDTLVKQVNGVSTGDIINVCIINFKDGREDCDSGTFNSNGSVEINIDVG
ncbi:MAG TPA: hypothetical protein VFU79_03710 [Nitrososphaeraceae archaeon]|nr:hypothetical protein [Nitrososphaeraceae archaeon]